MILKGSLVSRSGALKKIKQIIFLKKDFYLNLKCDGLVDFQFVC